MNPKFLYAIFDAMESSLHDEDKPCVGIFWYSPANKECFGVVKARKGESNYVKSGFGGACTCKELHKYVWKKEHNYDKFHDTEKTYFKGDYKDKPRGRVFFSEEDNKFYVMVGSWINDNPDAKKVILDEFNLNGFSVEFVENFHWDIGNGFGD